MPVKDRDLEQTDPKRLAEVIDLGTQARRLWEPEELEAILRHQLAADVESELGRLDPRAGPTLSVLCASAGPPIRTFADLLHHAHPPVKLLERTKQFARRIKSHPDSPLPGRIATVLYVTSILVARTQCAARISKMDNETLRVGVAWAIQQPWVDEATRSLLRKRLSALGARGRGE